MKKILIVYDSKSGSTEETSQIIRKKLEKKGASVIVKNVHEFDEKISFDAIIIGSPIRLSRCTNDFKKFMTTHFELLRQFPVALFFTCISLIRLTDEPEHPFHLFTDSSFGKTMMNKNEISTFAYQHSSMYYINYFLKKFPQIQPIKVAFFKGNLDFTKLRLWERIVMTIARMMLPELQQGEYINQKAIAEWVDCIYPDFICVNL